MTRKQPQRSVILGPDGKPYVAPTKKPEAKAETPKEDGGTIIPRSYEFTADFGGGSGWMARLLTSSDFGTGVTIKPRHPAKDLRAITSEQIDALTAGFEGHGGEELPTPPRDLTTYRDAHASARANCKHIDTIEVLYQRQWSCDDCGRILDREAMRRAGYGRGYFG